MDSAVGDKDKLAEFSVGLNPKARFINDITVDKKELGTVHIAIGNNKSSVYGGRTTAASTGT